MRDGWGGAVDIALSPTDLLWAAGSVCNLAGVPFTPALLQRECPPPCSAAQLVAVLGRLGLRARVLATGAEVPPRLLPAIVFLHPETDAADGRDAAAAGSPCAGSGVRTLRVALLVRCDADRVLLFHAGSNEPATMPIERYRASTAGQVLAVEVAAAAGDGDAIEAPGQGFGWGWFAARFVRHRRSLRDVLAASLAVQLLGLAAPLLCQVVIDKVIPHEVEGTLAVVAAALALTVVFTAALGWIRQHLVIHVGTRVDAVLGGAVFRHLIALPLPFFERRPTGVLAARLAGVETIRDFLCGAALTLLFDLPFAGFFLVLMFTYSAPLTLIALAFAAALAGVSAVVAPLFRRRLDEQFLRGARNQALLTEHLAAIETVKSLQMEPSLAGRFDDGLRDYLTASCAARRLGNTYATLTGALEQLQGAAVLCAGALLAMRGGDFTIGMLVAFQMFAGRLTAPLVRLAGLWQQFQMASVAVRRLADVMDVPCEPRGLVAAGEGCGPAGLRFEDVTFAYDAARPPVLRSFDLVVAPGECVAVVGASGSGKSTLAKLLQGFVHPTGGAVRVDGRDTRSLGVNELRAALGVVPQETVLFAGCIHDNVAVGHPHATHDAVVEACRLAGIHADLDALPEGYRTRLGERGSGLSGGQRQRVAIARALLRRPRALLFDEATSNLDPAVAEEVAATIARFRGRATILFITHRIPAALKPDRVVALRPTGAAGVESIGHGTDRGRGIIKNIPQPTPPPP